MELTIRKLITVGAGAAALCVLAAFVVAPATVLAEG
jgi:hypothetical protein